jgi:hypothetical protein
MFADGAWVPLLMAVVFVTVAISLVRAARRK